MLLSTLDGRTGRDTVPLISQRGNDMKLFVGLAVVMALAGCSTSPVTVNNADPVPASRLHAFSGKSDAKLIVTRDTGLYGSGVNYSIYKIGRASCRERVS